MTFEACMIALAVILAAVMICNTIENIAKDFLARWDALEDEEP